MYSGTDLKKDPKYLDGIVDAVRESIAPDRPPTEDDVSSFGVSPVERARAAHHLSSLIGRLTESPVTRAGLAADDSPPEAASPVEFEPFVLVVNGSNPVEEIDCDEEGFEIDTDMAALINRAHSVIEYRRKRRERFDRHVAAYLESVKDESLNAESVASSMGMTVDEYLAYWPRHSARFDAIRAYAFAEAMTEMEYREMEGAGD